MIHAWKTKKNMHEELQKGHPLDYNYPRIIEI
jgi:hypothetical protein